MVFHGRFVGAQRLPLVATPFSQLLSQNHNINSPIIASYSKLGAQYALRLTLD